MGVGGAQNWVPKWKLRCVRNIWISNWNCLRAKRAKKKWEIGIVLIGNCDQNLHNTISIWNYFGVLTNTISILNSTGFFSGALRAQIEIEIAPKFCSFFCISNFNVENLELEGGDNYTISSVLLQIVSNRKLAFSKIVPPHPSISDCFCLGG